ncbi:MAG: chemotaxis protein CheW [Nitrospira bacterium SG8_35_1]|jgi:purine-binding chemotaxis protein CheW|nr:MAG: chemotaxis protein CheW [Nitrospira bacterium SG8_35_1]
METLKEASTAREEVLQFVTFTLNNEEYAVDILSVQEINRITEITKIPNSPPYVEGVVNLRGKVIPVINLRNKFGFEEKTVDDTSRIIIMEIRGITYGVIVDSVSEVLRVQSDTVEPTPPMSSDANSKFIKGLAKLDDRLIILIDIDNLIDEELQI